jgi:hypothetical protein
MTSTEPLASWLGIAEPAQQEQQVVTGKQLLTDQHPFQFKQAYLDCNDPVNPTKKLW